MIDDKTRGLLEGMADALDACRANLAMYAHRPDIPALKSAEFWLSEVTLFLGHDPERACSLGVGCDEAGVCYAAAHDQPGRCPVAESVVFEAFVAGWQAHRFAPHIALETAWGIHERAAIADTRPKDGDALAAPLASGSGAKQSPITPCNQTTP